MSVTWDEYLRAPNAGQLLSECNRRCKASFHQQRRNLQRVMEATRPRAVACLGAGVLNDIPYEMMVKSGASIHLVDWLPQSIDSGIAMTIIQSAGEDNPQCIYCHAAVDCPHDYCRRYDASTASSSGVCRNFVPVPGSPLHCASFERGERPSVHYEDVTGGYASAFGRQVLNQLRHVRTWRQALARGKQLAAKVKRRRSRMAITDGSVQLVTSSMLVSQFDHEPYQYFTRRAEDILGAPTSAEEDNLLPAAESLRAMLFTNQVERHCEEIVRLLAPEGRCYMSFEMFHIVPDSMRWFLVPSMARALDIVARHFFFDFDIIPERESITRFQSDGQESLVLSVVLEARNGRPSDHVIRES